jgi:dihydrofolate reductase
MRQIIVLTFLTLDGVMQAPGGPDEDTSGGTFRHGGWTVPYFDETLGEVMTEQMEGRAPADLLLGRKTFEVFANYWPQHGGPIHEATKYVVSNRLTSHPWQKTVFLGGDVATAISQLKKSAGPDLQVHGSSQLIQTLLKHDLVDELWLKVFPVTLGQGKRLFGEGTLPAAFKLTESKVTPAGVITANYQRAGEVKTGSF